MIPDGPLSKPDPHPNLRPDPRSDAELLVLLDRHIAAGRIILTLDRRKLSSADFPLAFESEANLWVYPLLGLIGAASYFGGFFGGSAAFLAAFAVYQRIARPWIARRIEARIRGRALKDIAIWRKLWHFGGVILRSCDGGTPVQGPEGHWTGLVRRLD